MEDNLMYSVKEYLVKKYDCHSIILYGSFANGDYTEESDIDLVCFCDSPTKENDTIVFNDRRLDAWIYKTETMSNCTQFLHVIGGKVLLDKRNLCADFLSKIDEHFKKGPIELSLERKEFLKSWLLKMLRGQRRETLREISDAIGC